MAPCPLWWLSDCAYVAPVGELDRKDWSLDCLHGSQAGIFVRLPITRQRPCRNGGSAARPARHLQEVDVDYRASPLSVEPDGEFDSGPCAGSQAPDAAPLLIADRRMSFYALPSGVNHRLLLFHRRDNGPPSAELRSIAARVAAEHGHCIDVLLIAATQEVVEDRDHPNPLLIGDPDHVRHTRYAAEHRCLYLICPDGYISYRSRQVDGLESYLRVDGMRCWLPMLGSRRRITNASLPRMIRNAAPCRIEFLTNFCGERRPGPWG